MTKDQKINRSIIDNYWKPVRNIKDDVKVILRDCLLMMKKKMKDSVLEFYTDEHTSYPSALKEIEEIKKAMEQEKFVHYTYSSKLSRTADNPLFPVNYVDQQTRKIIGEHVCEKLSVVEEEHTKGFWEAWSEPPDPARSCDLGKDKLAMRKAQQDSLIKVFGND